MECKRLLGAGAALGLAVALAATAAVTAGPHGPTGQPPVSLVGVVADPVAAVAGAERLLAEKAPAVVRGGKDEKYAARPVVSSPQGLQYVTFDRQYQGLPVVGGDFTVVTDARGTVKSTSVAQTETIDVSVTPTVTAEQARATARARLHRADEIAGQRLTVLAWGTPTLAWETIVAGATEHAPSLLHVFVDARTGAVLRSYDDVAAEVGEGTGYYNGPNPLRFDTTLSGGTYTLTDPKRPGLSCANIDNSVVYSGPDNKWGNGQAMDKETGCADAMFGAQRELDMLKEWYGRNGIDGNGKSFQIRVGLQEANAYWTGGSAPYMKIGYNQNKDRWLAALDVVGHEFGHAIDQYTGGSAAYQSGESGLGESIGDIFGALTEAYANEPSEFDPADYTVGEEVDFFGNGKAMRVMYKPADDGRSANCFSSSTPNAEVHDAAGPMNHWFYLLAEGSAPNGKPASPTCNNKTVAGLRDIRKAGAIFYNALLAKTSNMTHAKMRGLTLQAAKNIDPTCAQYTAVKEAWDAVSVPAASGEATCSGSTPTASPSASPTVKPSPSASPTASPSSSPTQSPTGQPGTVTVTNPGNQSAWRGFQAWPLQVRATTSNGGALNFTATGLPPGLTISAAGVITGTPTTVGTYTVKVTATGGAASGSTTFTYQITGF
ncbi:M4 family metallopeptidase [Longispora sp. NPDC051575]|uniref:M4 family metallopeptidase n=1 Tax=Longispora sp. NPDC051575 TaxID=3154943 RepID=UPI003412B5A4